MIDQIYTVTEHIIFHHSLDLLVDLHMGSLHRRIHARLIHSQYKVVKPFSLPEHVDETMVSNHS